MKIKFKVKVLREFVDKYTKKAYKINEEIVIDKTRYDEIQRVGNLVEKIDEVVVEEKTNKVTKKINESKVEDESKAQ